MNELLNPSTIEGAYFIGITSGVISGAIIGFFSGKAYQKKYITKSIQKGNRNINIQNSKLRR